MNIKFLTFIIGLCGLNLYGQIDQTHPELCGKPDSMVPLPPGISVSVDRSQGSAEMFLGERNTSKSIELPGVVDNLAQVCPLADGRYLLFGETYNGTNMILVDPQKKSIVDHFDGFDPAMSPDQRWIAYRKFYPRHHDLSVSEEYLLYDLSKTPAQNRAPGIELSDWEDVGTAIFPLGWKNLTDDHSDLPPEQTHVLSSRSFHWAPDSGAVVFGDTLQNQFAVILIIVGKNGETNAYEHHVTMAEVCGADASPKDFGLVLSNASVSTPNEQGRSVKVEFDSAPGICEPHSLELQQSDFQKPLVEVPVKHPPKLKAITVDQ